MKGNFILLGSNEGNRIHWLQMAYDEIKRAQIRPKNISSIWETKAWGLENQPDFLNVILEIETTYSVWQLLEILLSIENLLGRTRGIKWGQRIIDIDILYFQNLIVNHPQLTIPHPQIVNRRFTLLPLTELIPQEFDPVHNKKIEELLELCVDLLACQKTNLTLNL